jgi:hypothetical protein
MHPQGSLSTSTSLLPLQAFGLVPRHPGEKPRMIFVPAPLLRMRRSNQRQASADAATINPAEKRDVDQKL